MNRLETFYFIEISKTTDNGFINQCDINQTFQ